LIRLSAFDGCPRRGVEGELPALVEAVLAGRLVGGVSATAVSGSAMESVTPH